MAAEKLLSGRTLLVVGASSGIGRETARWAAGQGAKVAAVARRRGLLDRLVDEMPQGLAIDADLRDPDQCESLVARAVDHLGKIDAMVFAASASSLAMTSEAGAETWKLVLETNVMAPALVTRALLPHLSRKAFLAYLSSEIVGQPYHGLAHYASSKAALEELVRALRTEHPAYRFCCLRVGATLGTDFARDFSMELNVELLPQWIARAKLPSEFLQPEDVGSAIGEAVAIALARPGIDVQDLTIRPPGGPFTGDVGTLAQMASENEFGT